MEYYHIKDGVLEAYTGREEIAVVPAGIHTIGEGAFKACVSLRKVIFPAGLRRIGDDAFKGCRRLEEIEISQGVEEIGNYAFHRCHALRRISLPDSVKILGDCAFLYCDSLTKARIPGVVRLGKQAFLNDVLLESLELSPNLDMACICDVFTGCARITDISFAGGESWHIGNAVEVMAAGLKVPLLVSRIAEDILKMMELDGRCLLRFLVNLKSVEIPEGIESVAKSCFFDKRGIQSVCFPKSFKEIGSRAFRNCINLEMVSFKGDNVHIQEDAFRNCNSLKTVRTSDGREYVFSGIHGLTEEGIPELVRIIQKQIMGNFRISGTILLKYIGAEARVAVPEGITEIAGGAFAGNEAVDRVILPESLQEIGEEAFKDCVVLQTISFPERLVKIKAGAFENCVKLIRAAFPPGIKRIEERCFQNCKTLREVNFSKELLEIKESAFYHCTSLKNIQFPDSLVSIGKMAFYQCKGLREIQLLQRIEEVGSLAFAKSGIRRARIEGSGERFESGIFNECRNLKTLILASGVRYIPDKLAYSCTALQQVILPESIVSVGRHVWEDTPYLEIWREGWKRLKENKNGAKMAEEKKLKEEKAKEAEIRTDIFEEKVKEAEIRTDIFFDGRDLEGEVWISNDVRVLAGGAFYGNTEVTEVHLPKSICSVGKAAFKGCKKLQKVYWLCDVKNLEAEVFSGCVSLQQIIVSEEAVRREISGYVSPRQTISEETVRREISGCVSPRQTISEEAVRQEMPKQEIMRKNEIVNDEITENKMIKRDSIENEIIKWDSIGERAFYNCKSLEELCLSQTKSIGREAFCGCTALSPCGINPELWVEERAFFGTRFFEEKKNELCIIGNILVSGEQCEGRICLPENITKIAPYAFAGNKHITEVVLPQGFLKIGEGAFFGCSGLTAVKFPKGLREIGARAFEKCASLEMIVTDAIKIGKAAFAFCIKLLHAELSGIKRFADSVFEGCRSLVSCVCKNAYEAGTMSFCGCAALREFDFSHLKRIGEYAFADCDNLCRIILQTNVSVQNYAFKDCGRLEELWILENRRDLEKEQPNQQDLEKEQQNQQDLEKEQQNQWELEKEQQNQQDLENEQQNSDEKMSPFFQEYAFYGCTALSQVKYQDKLWKYSFYQDIFSDALLEQVRLIFHSALSCFEIEQGALYAYHGTGRIVKIPQGISKIEAEVFRDCTMLSEIEVPDSVEYIGARAFHGTAWIACRQLENPLVIVNHMLLDGSKCEGEVTIPAKVRMICGWAFANGMGITSIRFLKDTKVEQYAFRNCIFLRELILPNAMRISFTGLKDREKELPAMAKQAAMDSLNCFKTNDKGVLVECTGNISRLLLPYGITAIGESAFLDGNLLTEIIFSETVQSIEKSAFSGCKWLRQVQRAQQVERIGKMAFFGCQRLQRVTLSEKLQKIEERAFENCTSLEAILIPEGIEEIPKRAFYRCHSLKSIQFPSTLKRIGKEAFAFCIQLEDALLPEGVVIEERAFYKGGEPK